ncbi:uncharacterized protein LOC132215789 [Myotis daubentonii]|uniref:uncharacterized protein LOC132215789 n=1 Tax=Myotis daubentonii TaxID=98922 RepID=UPI002873DE93|nr:uncharacterized protein LOC132215789 [Myotis daubentonii]
MGGRSCNRPHSSRSAGWGLIEGPRFQIGHGWWGDRLLPGHLRRGQPQSCQNTEERGATCRRKPGGLPGGAGFSAGPGGGGGLTGRMLRQKEAGLWGPVSPSGDVFLGEEPVMVRVGTGSRTFEGREEASNYAQRSTRARLGSGCGERSWERRGATGFPEGVFRSSGRSGTWEAAQSPGHCALRGPQPPGSPPVPLGGEALHHPSAPSRGARSSRDSGHVWGWGRVISWQRPGMLPAPASHGTLDLSAVPGQEARSVHPPHFLRLSTWSFVLFCFLIDIREDGRDRNINDGRESLVACPPLLGIKPPTQACALTWN